MIKKYLPTLLGIGSSLALAGTALAQTDAADITAQETQQALDELNTAAAEAAVASTGVAAVGIGMMFFWLIFGVLGLILFIWALLDVLKRDFPNPNDKIIWILVIVLLGVIGPIIYLVAGRKKGTSISGTSAPKQ